MSASIMSMASIRRPNFSGSRIRWYGTAAIVLRATEPRQGQGWKSERVGGPALAQ